MSGCMMAKMYVSGVLHAVERTCRSERHMQKGPLKGIPDAAVSYYIRPEEGRKDKQTGQQTHGHGSGGEAIEGRYVTD